MNPLPNHFVPCRIDVEIASFGTAGTIVGILFHYPCWVGILEPMPAFDVWEAKVRDLLDDDELDIQLHNLASEETWFGTLSYLGLPRSDHPWYELTWQDNKTPLTDRPESFGGRIVEKLKGYLWRFLSTR